MQGLFPCCAGLDVHKKSVVACLVHTQPTGAVTSEVRTFATTTRALLELRDWLEAAGCTDVALESTGAYWRPVYNLLEGGPELWLVNAYHCKNVPGRKTDVRDAEWLADLLRHGLLRASFVPPLAQRDLRELTRLRSHLVEERARCTNRLQQALEGANLKLASVVTDVTGVSARAMLAALRDGTTDPQALAQLARGKLQKKQAELEAALEGRVREPHRFLLAEFLTQLTFLDEQVARFDAQIEAHITQMSDGVLPPAVLPPAGEQTAGEQAAGEQAAGELPGVGAETALPARPRRGLPPEEPPTFAAAVRLLDTIPGVARNTAENIVAETGVDMGRFPSERHLTAWAGVAPGHHVSAGKRYAGRIRAGNPALRKALVQAAHGAIRTKGSFFQALYQRLAARRGRKRAIVAVARHLLVVIYHVLLYHEPYRELGADYYAERKKESVVNGLLRRLEKFGYEVNLTQLPAAA